MTSTATAAPISPTSQIQIQNADGMQYLSTIPNGSVGLVLTDPPYIISRDTGMNAHYNAVKQNEKDSVEFVKTEAEWIAYNAEHAEHADPENADDQPIDANTRKRNYMKYGTIYGKKYCVKTDFGTWDSEFSMELLDGYVGEYYKKLKQGGTAIIFFDLWKISYLKEVMEKHKFKQIRMIEWIKTNPQPLNSSVNYLTNCREVALIGVKGGKGTFHSKYDNGIYQFPLQGGKNRIHPTQKSLSLFEALIEKHSNVDDVVLDTFLGGGTTAIACKRTNRQFRGCEISPEYYAKVLKILAGL